MSENDTKRFTEDDGSLAGDALLHAMRRDMLGLFKALDAKVEALDAKVGTLDQRVEALDAKIGALDQRVEALDQRVEALDAKVEARLRDTTPMWEVVVARLDTVIAEQENHGRRLDAIEGRLDAIEGEQGKQGARLDAIEGRLDAIAGEQGKQGARLDAIEGEIRQLRRRNEAMISQLSHDIIDVRAAQHDLEGQLEKLEKTPA
jgi:chromosome segregation ATPase